MAFSLPNGIFKEFSPCDGCEVKACLEDRSPNLKKDVGRAMLELLRKVKEDATLGVDISRNKEPHR